MVSKEKLKKEIADYIRPAIGQLAFNHNIQ